MNNYPKKMMKDYLKNMFHFIGQEKQSKKNLNKKEKK